MEDSVFSLCPSPQLFLLKLALAEGPVARFRINDEPFAVLSDPNGIHAVLNGSLEDFERGSFADIGRRILGESVFTLDGREWTGHHAILAPMFSRRRVSSLAPLIEGLVSRQIEAWDRLSEGDGIDMLTITGRLAFDVVARGLLGITVTEIADEVFDALSRIIRIEWVRLSYLAKCTTGLGEHFAPSPLYGRIDELMYAIADQRMTSATPADDLIGAAMASPLFAALPAEKKRTFLRDLIASMLSAGYANTGASIFWTLYLLARHPAAQARVRSDLRAVHAAARPWFEAPPSLTAAFNESLRLYPPVWFTGRIPRKPIRLGAEEIPAGTRLITSPWVLHRMPALWPEPEEFRPERFLPDAVVAPRNFIPFGSGMRACLGQSLALSEMSAFLSATLSRFDVRLKSEEPVSLAATFTLQPRQRVLFEVRRCR
jgi:cytochrome P450